MKVLKFYQIQISLITKLLTQTILRSLSRRVYMIQVLTSITAVFTTSVSRLNVLHCKKFIVEFTKYLGNFETKTLGKFCKPVCSFCKIGHTFKTNRITFSAKYFGPQVTNINCLNYKQNMKIMRKTVCLFHKKENLY